VKSFCYQCEINLAHPHVMNTVTHAALSATTSTRVALIISRMFPDEVAAFKAIYEDIAARTNAILSGDKTAAISQVTEMNPLDANTPEDLEARQEDAKLAEYLATWDEKTVGRVTCTTEELIFDDDGDLVNLPEEFIFKYYVTAFEDGMEIPEGTLVVTDSSAALH
jgi:hypothetical protein